MHSLTRFDLGVNTVTLALLWRTDTRVKRYDQEAHLEVTTIALVQDVGSLD